MNSIEINKLAEGLLVNLSSKISFSDASDLINIPDSLLDCLLENAEKIKLKYLNKEISTCSIINAKSGKCAENCKFCAQSMHYNTNVKTHNLLSVSEIIAKGLEADQKGITNYSAVTAGTNLSDVEIDILCLAYTYLKKYTNLTLCASLGLLTEKNAQKLKESGVKKYHHNLETAESFFLNICSTHDYVDDIKTIEIAKKVGLKICSGGILGLGESPEQRIELAYTLSKLDVDSIPINFLNPILGTPLENQAKLTMNEALKAIAVFRFINPTKPIIIAGGRELIMKDNQDLILKSGASGIMVGNYLTTFGRNIDDDFSMIKEYGLSQYLSKFSVLI